MVRKLIFSVAVGITFASAQPSLPDTPAGRTLRAWLDAVNTGDRARMEEYTRKHEPTRPADTLVNMRIKSGGFDLIGVDESEPTRLVFQVKERSSGRTAIGKMIVKDADPPTVVSLLLRIDTPGQPRPKDIVLDAPTRAAVIEGAIAKLNENYVFPDLAKKMEQHVRERHKRGEYDKVTDGDAFAALLTDHFREISKDKHLRVNYSAAVIPEPRPGGRSPEAISAYRKQMERTNCGFDKAERLEGNIGYLKFNFFANPEICGPTAIAAMNFLGGVDALIVDLRDNGGGEPAMIALISSYLFSEPTHLNDIYHRKDDTTSQFWTLPYVPGRRLDGKPVYVLTSSRTFSGAEEFSYNLKNLKRATIIGETTGGGAHPVSGHRIHEHFTIGVPFARAINPVSKTNWEGTGVEVRYESTSGPWFTLHEFVSAASYLNGAVTPGEAFMIFGHEFGPDTLAGPALDADGSVTFKLADLRVPFDGQPAAFYYVTNNQVAGSRPSLWQVSRLCRCKLNTGA